MVYLDLVAVLLECKCEFSYNGAPGWSVAKPLSFNSEAVNVIPSAVPNEQCSSDSAVSDLQCYDKKCDFQHTMIMYVSTETKSTQPPASTTPNV